MCSSFEYTWGFLEPRLEMQDDDEWVMTNKHRLVIGGPSLMYLMGTTIDYKEEVFGKVSHLITLMQSLHVDVAQVYPSSN